MYAITMADKDFVKERKTELEKFRKPWDDPTSGIWTQVEQFIRPITMQWGNGFDRPTLKTSKKIFDGTGITASRIFGNGFVNNTTPKGLPFIKAMVKDPYAGREIHEYLSALEEHTMWRLQESNFFEDRFRFVTDGADLGTAVCIQRKSIDGKRLVFQNMDIRQIYLDENEDGDVDTVLRCFKMPARQVIQHWGDDLDSETVRKLTELKGGFVEVTHFCYQRYGIDPRDKSNKNFPFASEYWLTGIGQDWILLEESGYKRMPYKVWRPERITGSAYGIGPGIKSLRDSQVLQQIGMTMLKAANWAVDPAWDIPGELEGDEQLFPGGRNYRVGIADPIRPIMPPIQYPIGDAERQRLQNAVREHYAVDYFMMLSNMDNSRERTILEIQELQAEKLSQIMTITESYMAEHLEPMIEDLITQDMEDGLIPPAPVQQTTKLEIRFNSPIAQVQRRNHMLGSAQQFLQTIIPVGQINASVWDAFDTDAYLRLVNSAVGAHNVVKDQQTVDQIRQQREQAQQAMMQQEQNNRNMIAQAEYASKLSKAGANPLPTAPGGPGPAQGVM